MSECQTKCKMCDKRGLPILLTRYAIAPHDAGAPAVQGGFSVTDQGGAKIDLQGAAQYTQRLLRSGYLYMYDEKRNRWHGYFITPDGYYMPFDMPKAGPTPPAIKGDPKKIVPCNPAKNGIIAGCITLSTPTEAGKVWFGFSDVEWTQAVWQRHQSADYRKRHMREFDVAKWLGSGAHNHACGIHLHAGYIAEYAKGARKQAFAFSPAQFNARSGQSAGLIHAFENLNRGKGVFLALNDPAGLAMDLAALMTSSLNAFMQQPARSRKLTISATIGDLRTAIYEQAKDKAIRDADFNARQRATQGGLSYPAYVPAQFDEAYYLRTRNPSSTMVREYQQEAWQKYRDSYSEAARQQFQREFTEQLAEFDRTRIAPLAVAHAAWMKSQRMAQSFQCNFDETNLDSGKVYLATVSLCIADTQDKQACFDLYDEWMDGSLEDQRNLLLRALVLNQQQLASIISKGAQVNIDPAKLPWDGMIASVGGALDRVMENESDILGRFIVQAGSTALNKLKACAEAGALPQGLVAMGVVSKSAIVRLEFTGSMRDFQSYLAEELIKARGEALPPHGLKAALNRHLRSLEVDGVSLEGTRKKRFLVMLNLDELKAVQSGLKPRAKSVAMAKTLGVADLRALNPGRWRNGLNRAAIWAKGHLPLGFSALAALAQWAALGSLTSDLEKSVKTGRDLDENRARHLAGWAAFGGTIAEALGTVVAKIPTTTLRLGQGWTSLMSILMKGIGKGLGILAAGTMAYWDVKKGVSEMQSGKQGLGMLYLASAGFGLGAAIILLLPFAWATLVGFILIALVLCIAVLIEFIKPNPIQEWLEGCIFGKDTFKTLDAEMRALKAISE
ncbi:hypothetical protein N8I74_04490 [Chitiniphilus purpureus]|uniref:Toxin VasX N-terminal region domain-containing protein n=1 Tax=Chitiniphilus purpureus TaxID=2981137 RepID=A0ABY6DPH0_9NEIS|nr:T6SS effector BTH_I2691 family protein [Chitiniphilus sp. CD1]UXY16284.1 hypothetical protein N8I74_04490 [Chitiniphilus sp. CD1]